MIETSTSVANSDTSGLRARAAEAQSISALAREAQGSRSLSVEIDGVTIERDTLSIASGARLLGEASGLRSARANAQEAAALAQTADAALDEIAERLDALEALATEAADADLSATDRHVLNYEFQTIRAEIDEIAQSTTFNGRTLLAGGDTPSDPVEIAFTVGSGSAASDRLTISIDAADSASLNSGLATADIGTQAGAASAVTDVQSASDELNRIRGAVRGAGDRAATAARGAAAAAEAADEAAAAASDVQVDIDFARLLGDQIVKEGKLRLAEPEAQLLRQTLITANSGDAKETRTGDPEKPKPPPKIPPDFPPELDID